MVSRRASSCVGCCKSRSSAARALASEVISQALSDNTVVIFSRTSCTSSNKVKTYFEDAGIPYYALELDTRADGDALIGALAEQHGGMKTLTGGVSTPAVFIRGQPVDKASVGGAAKSGELSHWATTDG